LLQGSAGEHSSCEASVVAVDDTEQDGNKTCEQSLLSLAALHNPPLGVIVFLVALRCSSRGVRLAVRVCLFEFTLPFAM